MAEEMDKYLKRIDIKSRYIHSDIDALERVEILRDLRLGKIDVLVGVNLLREGLDLPEVSLVAILDADKEGFLRNEPNLLAQLSGAATRKGLDVRLQTITCIHCPSGRRSRTTRPSRSVSSMRKA